jgi:hypothetical protein
MQEILVNRSQLIGQNAIKICDDLGITFHHGSPDGLGYQDIGNSPHPFQEKNAPLITIINNLGDFLKILHLHCLIKNHSQIWACE